MKTIFLTLLLPAILFAACKEEQCSDYAPAGTEVSWTESNPIEDVLQYFYCHRKTVEMHIGDTLKVEGYFLYPQTNPETLFYRGGSTHAFLGADPDVPEHKQQAIIVGGPASVMSAFYDYRRGQKVYLTIVIDGLSIDDRGCCQPMKCMVIEVNGIEKK